MGRGTARVFELRALTSCAPCPRYGRDDERRRCGFRRRACPSHGTPPALTARRAASSRPSLDVKIRGRNCSLSREDGVLSLASSQARPLCRYPTTGLASVRTHRSSSSRMDRLYSGTPEREGSGGWRPKAAVAAAASHPAEAAGPANHRCLAGTTTLATSVWSKRQNVCGQHLKLGPGTPLACRFGVS